MQFHHVGCAVRDLEASLRNYGGLLGGGCRRSPIYDVASQAVRVCFVELAPGSYLELISGTSTASPVERYYRAGFYHLCFLVDELDRAVTELGSRFRPLPAFASEAFG